MTKQNSADKLHEKVEWAVFDGELPNTKEWMQLCFDKLRMTLILCFKTVLQRF
jgi:hypothetical protein